MTAVAMAKAATNGGDTAARFRPAGLDFSDFKPKHFLWEVDGKVATITLNRPERKNPLTLESYAELRDTFRNLTYADGIKNVVITGAGGNFCSGGDVHEIIGPLVEMQRKDDMAGLLAFTRMTGQLVKEMRACPQPIVAAIDGICAGESNAHEQKGHLAPRRANPQIRRHGDDRAGAGADAVDGRNDRLRAGTHLLN